MLRDNELYRQPGGSHDEERRCITDMEALELVVNMHVGVNGRHRKDNEIFDALRGYCAVIKEEVKWVGRHCRVCHNHGNEQDDDEPEEQQHVDEQQAVKQDGDDNGNDGEHSHDAGEEPSQHPLVSHGNNSAGNATPLPHLEGHDDASDMGGGHDDGRFQEAPPTVISHHKNGKNQGKNGNAAHEVRFETSSIQIAVLTFLEAQNKASPATRRQIKRQLLLLGYDLASNFLGYESFLSHMANAGGFSRAVHAINNCGKHGLDLHNTTADMMKALTIPKFVKKLKKYRGERRMGNILNLHNTGKLVKKWGGVYRRIWAVKKRMERKAKKSVVIKIEEEGDE